jgi:Raf kinase inhibitor-like YbhB/YbcL family protein
MIGRLLGRLLKNRHAGEDNLMWNHPVVSDAPMSIRLDSPAFLDKTPIPIRYAGVGVGENISPPLLWENIPERAAELVVVIEDPDAPLPSPVMHVIVAGISPLLSGMKEGEMNDNAAGFLLGRNTLRRLGYAGPRPIPGHGPHRYVFQIYAVSSKLSFRGIVTRTTLLEAMQGKVIARGRLDGIYERQ